MCISLTASIVAGIVGELSALALARRAPAIGAWIATFSLIQFVEAAAYAGARVDAWILPLLYAQGVVFFGAQALVHKTTAFFAATAIVVVTAAIELVGTRASRAAEVACDATTGCRWKHRRLSVGVVGMYVLMFVFGIARKPRVVAVYAATLLVSLALRGLEQSPSMWCLMSAVVSPAVVLLH